MQDLNQLIESLSLENIYCGFDENLNTTDTDELQSIIDDDIYLAVLVLDDDNRQELLEELFEDGSAIVKLNIIINEEASKVSVCQTVIRYIKDEGYLSELIDLENCSISLLLYSDNINCSLAPIIESDEDLEENPDEDPESDLDYE